MKQGLPGIYEVDLTGEMLNARAYRCTDLAGVLVQGKVKIF